MENNSRIIQLNNKIKTRGVRFLSIVTLCSAISLIINCGPSVENHHELQIKFAEERKSLYEEYKSAKNDIKKSAVFNKSRSKTCEFSSKHGQSFVNWYGKIYTLTTDQGGDEIQTFKITSKVGGITITYQNYAEIKMGSNLYNLLADFAEGDWVYFNYTFDSAGAINSTEEECFDETSWSEYGSLNEPEFHGAITKVGLEPLSE